MPSDSAPSSRSAPSAEGAEARLEVKNLRAAYGDNVVLHDVSLTVPPGEIRIILGASGCGKSTLLKNIIGLEKAQSGSIRILGQEVDWKKEALDARLMQRLGVLFQGSALLTSLTVGENVALPLIIHSPGMKAGEREERVREKLKQVRMEHAHDKLPGELSGGMKKRAGLARAIVTDPELLFCDEPSAGLDPITSRALDDLLLDLREELGIAMVIVTHELESIRTLCDKMTFLSRGRVIFDGRLDAAEKTGPEEVRDFLARRAGKEGKGAV